MTAPDWSAMLAAEEERAMAGKPAWRVRAACVAGVACPRCMAAIGVKCGTRSKPVASCRERVWAMRALQRAHGKAPMVADVAPFLDTIAGVKPGDATSFGWRVDLKTWALASGEEIADADLAPAIRHGLVRLSISGAPVWVVTEAGAEYAAGWER